MKMSLTPQTLPPLPQQQYRLSQIDEEYTTNTGNAKYWYTGELKGQKVTVCVMRPGLALETADLQKFIEEENAASIRIRHPNLLGFTACTCQTNLICTIYEESVGENLYECRAKRGEASEWLGWGRSA